MNLTNNVILNHEEITHKIRRIAFQIYESNVDEKEVILAGIDSNGYLLAEKLKNVLESISDITKMNADKVSELLKNTEDLIKN